MQIPHPHQDFFELMRKLQSRGSSAPSALRCCPNQTPGLSESLESSTSAELQFSLKEGFSPRNSFPRHRLLRVPHHPPHWAQPGHCRALTSCSTVTFPSWQQQQHNSCTRTCPPHSHCTHLPPAPAWAPLKLIIWLSK